MQWRSIIWREWEQFARHGKATIVPRFEKQGKGWHGQLLRRLAVLFPLANASSASEFGWNRPTTWPAHAQRSRPRQLLVREFSIPEATLLLMAAFLFSALLGSVRQVLLNTLFGTGEAANAYYAAFRLPDALFSLIAGGALSSAMIPILLSAEREDGRDQWERLFNLVLTSLFAALVVIVVAGEIFAPAFVHHILAPGFDAETSHLTITLTRIMLAQPLILAAGSVATAVLNSRRQFLLTAISFASHNVAIISGIVLSWVFPSIGIYGPTFGVLGGAALQMILLIPGIRDNGLHVHLAWDPYSVRLRQVVRLLIPNGLSVGVGICRIHRGYGLRLHGARDIGTPCHSKCVAAGLTADHAAGSGRWTGGLPAPGRPRRRCPLERDATDAHPIVDRGGRPLDSRAGWTRTLRQATDSAPLRTWKVRRDCRNRDVSRAADLRAVCAVRGGD